MAMTKKEFNKLLRDATNFRKGILEGQPSKAMCFAVAAPLQGYLSFTGLKCRLIEGGVGEWVHFWIELPDGTILDPTADQFESPDGLKMPPVYIGKKPDWYLQEAIAL